MCCAAKAGEASRVVNGTPMVTMAALIAFLTWSRYPTRSRTSTSARGNRAGPLRRTREGAGQGAQPLRSGKVLEQHGPARGVGKGHPPVGVLVVRTRLVLG